jgi:haloalkane dehalogenase
MSDTTFAEKKFIEIKGRRMAYIEEGEGAPIVFQHGNPTSSYLWRNVMPHLRGLGRLIAADLIGMGDSDKLPNSGPHRYTYAEVRSFLFALWEELKVEKDVASGRPGRTVCNGDGTDMRSLLKSRKDAASFVDTLPG